MLSDKGTYIVTRFYSIFGEVKKEATMLSLTFYFMKGTAGQWREWLSKRLEYCERLVAS